MWNKKSTEKIGAQRAFTLIEMMVSVAIFTMVLSASVGTLLAIVDSNRKVQSIRVAMDSLDLVLDDMTRNITQGSNFDCGTLDVTKSCPAGDDEFHFNGSDNGSVVAFTYRKDGDVIEKTIGLETQDLTVSAIFKVTNLTFYVFDAEALNDNQPRVLITVSGTTNDKWNSEFTVQTSIAQRVPKAP